MNFDVFISYAIEDKATADAACARLEADGIRCWIAPRDVPPGAEWAGAIVDAIDHCRAMVLIFSSSANGSKQIHREVHRAFDKEVPVVPFRIENIVPEKSLAYYMGPVHWLDALTLPLEQHLQRLAVSVKTFVQINTVDGKKNEELGTREGEARRRAERERAFATAEGSDTVGAPGEGRKTWQPSRRALLTACVLGVVLVGSVGVWLADIYRTPGPFDGRWSATVGPQGPCEFTSTLLLDVMGSSIVGNATNPSGVFPLSGTVDPNGKGVFKIGSLDGTVRFSGTTFEANYANSCGGRFAIGRKQAAGNLN